MQPSFVPSSPKREGAERDPTPKPGVLDKLKHFSVSHVTLAFSGEDTHFSPCSNNLLKPEFLLGKKISENPTLNGYEKPQRRGWQRPPPAPPRGWSSKQAMNAELTGEEGRGKSYEWKQEIFFSTPFAGGVEKAEVTITSGGRTFRYLKLYRPPLLLPFKTNREEEEKRLCASLSTQNPLLHWGFWRRWVQEWGRGGRASLSLSHPPFPPYSLHTSPLTC